MKDKLAFERQNQLPFHDRLTFRKNIRYFAQFHPCRIRPLFTNKGVHKGDPSFPERRELYPNRVSALFIALSTTAWPVPSPAKECHFWTCVQLHRGPEETRNNVCVVTSRAFIFSITNRDLLESSPLFGQSLMTFLCYVPFFHGFS